jgi:hypothetical protein
MSRTVEPIRIAVAQAALDDPHDRLAAPAGPVSSKFKEFTTPSTSQTRPSAATSC